MNVMLIAVAVVYVVTCIVQGLNFLTVLSLISTILFMSRKFGHFCKMKSLLGLEFIGIFLQAVYYLVFSTMDWTRFIIAVGLRFVFICIAYYDMTAYVYVTEKHRKGEKEDL